MSIIDFQHIQTVVKCFLKLSHLVVAVPHHCLPTVHVQGSHATWKTLKTWNLRLSFPGLENAWNLTF